MLDRTQILQRIQDEALIAVLRCDSAQQAVDTCKALRDGGVTILEVALTTPGGIRAIEQLVTQLPDCLIGAGTVMSVEAAHQVADAGAAFVFAPNVNLDVIAAAKSRDRVVVPGALTPTEIATAWDAGADVIKLFPANHFGPKYIKDIHGPMPQVKITPTGGVELGNIKDWFAAGAVAVGVGTSMVRKDLVKAGKWTDLSAVARQYVEAVRTAR